ncbi:MAG: long-chain fatty acid--CoA ligase [Bacteroidetes bacterium HGW-Bacteroidetes-20]|nr:MAG: long-chain fatty acid--CoA ligase [Bacteroidetes bacterium HGW-Bacteroidetes-20]
MRKTIIDFFNEAVEKFSNNDLLLEKRGSVWTKTSYAESKIKALQIGAGLNSLGVQPKDRIAILSEGRNAWILSELGLLYAGAISVPLSIKLEESNDLIFRLIHAEVSVIMISISQLPKIRKIINELPHVKHIVVFERVNGGAQEDPFILEGKEMWLEQLMAEGKLLLDNNPDTFLTIGAEIQNDDIATITYTSGTTADPKGVILTHRNYTANVEQALTTMTIPPSWRTLIILPLDHCFAHVAGFYSIIACGASIATVQSGKTGAETLKNIPINIKEIKPHFLLSVPALAKNFRKNIESSIKAKGAITNGLFKFAMMVTMAYNKDGYTKGSGLSFLLKPLVNLFDKILFKKVREAFGGELQFFIGGGALLDIELQKFFFAIGIPMYQGYGLSEATPIISTNCMRKHKMGSSGILVSPLEMKIMDEEGNELPLGQKGEMVIKGENVMAGYWKNPKSSAETIKDGWLHTGDLGYMTKEGFLYVLGRYKSLLIASDGEKYSPEGFEEALVEKSPYIDQVVLYNNQNPYTVALLVINKEAIKNHVKNHHKHLDEKSIEFAHAAIQLIQDEINKFKSKGIFAGEFPERWLPSTFALIDEPFSEKNGLVNSTMKVIRGKVEERYKNRIEFMYTSEGKNIINSLNENAIIN